MVRLRGLEVRVCVVGEGEPLLLLNGLTRPLESWSSFTQALTGQTVVSFDAPGVGASPTPILPLSISTLASIAAAVLDVAGFETADILGFSHGGAVAQQLAVDSPAKVRRLVLVSTSCGLGATPGTNEHMRGFSSGTDPDSGNRLDLVGALWHSLAISSWSSIPFLGAIQASTLVVCGSHDRVVPSENSRVLARRIPDAELVMLPAGHDMQRPGPARALAGAVDRFLAAQDQMALS